jgi:hypothetical protein
MRLPMSPWSAGLGQGALAGGLSAYGNVAEENERSKGEQRMILESALAALGGGVSAYRTRMAMNGNAIHLLNAIKAKGQTVAPGRLAALQNLHRSNPLLKQLPAEQWLNLGVTSVGAGLGSMVGGGMLAPFVADQLGLLQVPGNWTRRAHDWNWDRQIPLEQAMAAGLVPQPRNQETER